MNIEKVRQLLELVKNTKTNDESSERNLKDIQRILEDEIIDYQIKKRLERCQLNWRLTHGIR